jgi:hypothetical protein
MQLTKNVLGIIAEYTLRVPVKLPDWIDETKLDWNTISLNPLAIHLLEANPDRINWKYLSKNPAAIHLLKANLDRVDWIWLSGNPAAIYLIEENLDKIEQALVSQNSLGALLSDGWNWGSPNMRAITLLKIHPNREEPNLMKLIYTVSLKFECDQSVYDFEVRQFINDIAH